MANYGWRRRISGSRIFSSTIQAEALTVLFSEN
jgi:hypothetical protein